MISPLKVSLVEFSESFDVGIPFAVEWGFGVQVELSECAVHDVVELDVLGFGLVQEGFGEEGPDFFVVPLEFVELGGHLSHESLVEGDLLVPVLEQDGLVKCIEFLSEVVSV